MKSVTYLILLADKVIYRESQLLKKILRGTKLVETVDVEVVEPGVVAEDTVVDAVLLTAVHN